MRDGWQNQLSIELDRMHTREKHMNMDAHTIEKLMKKTWKQHVRRIFHMHPETLWGILAASEIFYMKIWPLEENHFLLLF